MESEAELLDGGAPFRLLDWIIHPSLNRLTRGETVLRVEPKQMDVLLLLARVPGAVVSKDEIVAEVWSDAFVTESVITRAIASLRKALGDDARAPRFLETIAKRGYRLVAPPRPVEEAATAPPGPEPAMLEGAGEAPDASAPPGSSPPSSSRQVVSAGQVFSAGQWVRGDRFFGREREIGEILQGPRNGVWILGTRAIGKTSLLRQLEYLTRESDGFFPLFWDLQGIDDAETLGEELLEVLSEAEDRLSALDISVSDVSAEDFFGTLGRLRRALKNRGRTLLLLWDEAEELIGLHESSPTLLRKLRRALLSKEGIRTVMASGPALWRLGEQRDETSPFLNGFSPPHYLGRLGQEPARALTGGLQLGFPASRSFEGEAGSVLEEIVGQTGGHPFLLQLLCSRYLRSGELASALASVLVDPAVDFFFSVDLALLSDLEREVLLRLASPRDPADGAGREDSDGPAGRRAIHHLERLGLICRRGDSWAVATPILRRWLAERAPVGASGASV